MLFVSSALAQTFTATPGTTRSYEVEAWSTDRTEAHPWGTDWKVQPYEAWGGILDCTMGEKRRETCTWRDGKVYWGAGERPDQLRVHTLHLPAKMEVVWSPTGKLKTWDVQGDRQDFWEGASNAMLQASFHRSDVVFRPAAIREQGQSLEESMLKLTVGWLEVQWDKAAAPQWKPKTPITGPRYTKFGVASHDTSYRVLPDGRWVLEGTISESIDNGTVNTAVAAVYAWEGDALVGLVGEALHYSSNVRLGGHRRNLVAFTQVTEQSDPRPTQLPPPLMKQ